MVKPSRLGILSPLISFNSSKTFFQKRPFQGHGFLDRNIVEIKPIKLKSMGPIIPIKPRVKIHHFMLYVFSILSPNPMNYETGYIILAFSSHGHLLKKKKEVFLSSST